MRRAKGLFQRHLKTGGAVLFLGAIAAASGLLWRGQWLAWNAQYGRLSAQLEQYRSEANALKSQNQYVINKALEEEIGSIQKTFGDAVVTYEDILKVKEQTKDTKGLDELFSDTLVFLSKRNYASAGATIAILKKETGDIQAKLAVAISVPENVAANNNPPGGGYSRQRVDTDAGSFVVDIIAADLSSTKIIVDTASDGTCPRDCPVLSLGDYVARNGAYAGVNGSYFCPADYPSCADKKNSFDTLLMNKNKVYFNSDNNVYSTVPAVIFGGGWVRFVSRSLEWGRDTGVDGGLANQPLLLMGGNISFGGDDDPKKGSKGNRSFVANRGNTVYIGVVYSATVAESARAMKALGMDNALNLDSGGSTALWSGGYKAGPGRNIPNAILFVRK